MQHIQDKDLDKLFKGVFEEAEVTPSKDIWKGISQEIDQKKKVKKLPVLWMAAASIAVVLTLTMLFSKQEKIQLSADAKPVIESLEEVGVQEIIVSSEPEIAAVPTFAPVIQAASIPAVRAVDIVHAKDVVPVQKEVPLVVERPEVIASEQPDPGPVVYAQIDMDNITMEVVNENDDRRKSVRNVGDLVNLVVEKFDKRDRKAIKFKTDDDDSSLIGLNIGILKFNSKKDR